MNDIKIPKRSKYGYLNFSSQKKQRTVYVYSIEAYRRLFEAEIRGEPFVPGVSTNRVKKSVAKHRNVPIGIALSYTRTHNGAKETSEEPLFTKKGNPCGKYGTFIEEKYIGVHFGDNRTQDEALASIIAYKKEGVYPPHAYYDSKSQTMLRFETEDSYLAYKKKLTSDTRVLSLIMGNVKNGKKSLYTPSGRMLGYFYINIAQPKKYRFGGVRTAVEALELLLTDAKEHSQKLMISYQCNGQYKVISSQNEKDMQTMVKELSSQVKDDHTIGMAVEYEKDDEGKKLKTPRGNFKGVVQGSIQTDKQKKHIRVPFGDDMSVADAKKSFLAYKKAGVHPSHAYFDLDTKELIRFNSRAEYKAYVDAKTVRLPKLRLKVGTIVKKELTYYTAKNAPLGVFFLDDQRIRFGRTRSFTEAFESAISMAVAEHGSDVQIEYVANGKIKRLSLDSERERKFALTRFRDELRETLKSIKN